MPPVQPDAGGLLDKGTILAFGNVTQGSSLNCAELKGNIGILKINQSTNVSVQTVHKTVN